MHKNTLIIHFKITITVFLLLFCELLTASEHACFDLRLFCFAFRLVGRNIRNSRLEIVLF